MRIGLVNENQQPANIGQRHFQSAAVANKRQTLQVTGLVVPVAVAAPRRLGHQTLLFVVADRLHFHARGAGQFFNLHGATLSEINRKMG